MVYGEKPSVFSLKEVLGGGGVPYIYLKVGVVFAT
jgi:hypothetical protein